MRKIWLVALITYKKRVRSGTFLILTFALPAVMVAIGIISVLAFYDRDGPPIIGVVDLTGQLAPVNEVRIDTTTLAFIPYDDADQAMQAFQRDEIGAYLIIPAGYFDGERAQYVGIDEPNALVVEGLRGFMRRAMLPEAPDWLLARIEDPSRRTFVALESGESMPEGFGMVFRLAAPAVLAFLLGLALVFTSSQMGATIVQEKEQRAMEIIITSLRLYELVAGKVLGMSLLSLTQIGVWAGGAALGVGLLLSNEIDWQQTISVPWDTLIWAVLLGFPGYLLYAVLAAGIGVIASDSQQAQQLAGFLGFFGLLPMWFAGTIIEAPDSPAAVGLSLFPLTGPIFSLLRMTFTRIPLWQLLASLGIVLASLAAAVWTVTRIFRAAMLLYGQALRPRQIVRALRQS